MERHERTKFFTLIIVCALTASTPVGLPFGSLSGDLAAQQATTLTPDTRLSAGALVHSPTTGITFAIPAGFEGGWDGGASGVLLQSQAEGSGFAGMWGVSQGTAAELAEAVGGLLAQEGMQLQLRSQPETVETITVAEYDAFINGGQALLVATLRDGPAGNSLVAAVLGSDPESARATAMDLARGASFAEPEANAWSTRAAGLLLTTDGVDSAYSPGGVGDGTYTSRSRSELALCRNGQYAYQSISESYVSVMGAGGFESTDTEEHQGRWSILSDLVGQAYLALEATDGTSYLWPLEETDQGAVVDGTAFAAGPGPC